jgi:hypothetical protein
MIATNASGKHTYFGNFLALLMANNFPSFTFMLPCIGTDSFLNNKPDALIIQIYSVIKLYMFRASSLPIIMSFLPYIWHWFHAGSWWPLPSRVRMELLLEFHPDSAWKRSSKTATTVPSWLCLEAVVKNLHETYHCRMYSRKLLMMGREDDRNM